MSLGWLTIASPFLLLQQQGPYVPRIEPASDEAQQAIQKFAPAKGIQVELFAAEPRLANPVVFYVDHGGVVYVAETFRHHQGVTDIRDHMDWLDDDLASQTVEDRRAMIQKHEGANYEPGYGRAFEQVRRIVDTDGDGVADADTVFATNFHDAVDGIGAGLLAYKGDVYYTCIPDLWKLRDADGDGVAEIQQKLSSGYGVHVALLGHDLHGLRIGPDRRLYFSCGDRAFHVETKEGVIAHPRSGAVLRCELDGSKLEVWADGLRNPQELTFDDYGNLWTGDNNSDGGDRARWVNVVEGGDSGWRYAYQWITTPDLRGPWNDEKLWYPAFAGQAAYIVPPVANLADGPAGLTHYPGTGLAPDYAGHFFLCDFRGDASYSGIHTFTVVPRGASWELGPVTPFLWGSLVTDCDFGPDGALWFSDWVYGWEQTGKGRLYRCVDPGAQRSALVAETRALLAKGMDGRSEDELVELLGHADQRVRQEAEFALVDRGAIGALARVAVGGTNLFARLHAIWALGIAVRQDQNAQGALLAACDAKEDEVRAQAIRVLGDERRGAAADKVLRALADPSPRLRFFAAIAAGRLELHEAVAPLARLLADAGETDRNLRHAGVMGLLGCATRDDLDRLGRDPSRDVRMGVLLVQRRQLDPTVARFLLDADIGLALEAARAIHDAPIPAAFESLALTRVDAERLKQGERAWVRRVLDAAQRVGRADVLASYALRDDLALESRVEALDLLAHWEQPAPRDHVTNEWRPIPARAGARLDELATRLASGPFASAPDSPPEVLAALARFAASAHALGAAPRLAAWVGEPHRASAVKSAALEALEALNAPELVPAVRTALGDLDGRVRASALERLERLAPAEALERCADMAAQGELAERRAAYGVLARHREAQAAEVLKRELAHLADALVPPELALDLLAACTQQGDPALAQSVEQRKKTRTSDALLAPYLDSLYGGERQRGRAVFERVDLSCTRCHAWWQDAAERVGPNLFGVGQRLTRFQVLESILGPNRRTTPGFGARAFFLKDGHVVSGRVFERSDELVRLFDANNNPLALAPADIEEERADLSAMPEDVAKSISAGEMRDLLEYLANL